MPSKVSYTVVGASGEAEGFSAKSLELHTPTVTGWQTPRFCTYPQELVLRLNESTKIRKLQLLSHQYMIPSKVEFFIAKRESPDQFKRLGYIYLSNNEKTGFKSRELKSVHVNTEGLFVRVLIHKNHLNKFNIYNQTCLMAFNVIGDPSTSNNNDFIDTSSSSNNKDYISPMDDLAFDMYQDPEVAEIIRRLDKRKKQAVREENFEVAKRMKQAINDLQKVGEKLARYELEKRKAVENEDYDLAKVKKDQMEDYRMKIYHQLQKYNLLEHAGVSSNPDTKTSPLRQSEQQNGTNNSFTQNNTNTNNNNDDTISQSYSYHSPSEINGPYNGYLREPTTTSPSPRNQIPQLNLQPISSEEQDIDENVQLSNSNYDDKVIPALANRNNKQPLDEFPDESYPSPVARTRRSNNPLDDDVTINNNSGPEAMSEKNIREASTAIDVFGLPLVAGAYSKTWSFREDTLLAVYKILNELPEDTDKEDLKLKLKAALFLVKRSIRDKVHSVFHASLRLLEMILVDFIPRHKLGRSEASRSVNLTLPNLIQKTGETAVRSRTTAIEFIDKMSGFPSVEPLNVVPQKLLQPFKKDIANRMALSRVEMAENLLDRFGIKEPSLTRGSFMKFAVPSLQHSNGGVREGGSKIIIKCYKLCGDEVKSYLPKADNKLKKNPLYRNLFDNFDVIDGKPTEKQLQQQALEEEKRKKEEMDALQEQVNQLRAQNKDLENANKNNNNKTKRKPTPQPEPAPAPVEDTEAEEFMDKMCIFCGEHDENFTESGLDMHYWKECPMLKRCEYCNQVVEIPLYGQHLLNECERKSEFGKCPRCGEVMLKTKLKTHVPAKKCPVLNPALQEHCPMCNKNINSGEESWKKHLMGGKRDSCKENPRRLPHINKLKAKKPGNTRK